MATANGERKEERWWNRGRKRKLGRCFRWKLHLKDIFKGVKLVPCYATLDSSLLSSVYIYTQQWLCWELNLNSYQQQPVQHISPFSFSFVFRKLTVPLYPPLHPSPFSPLSLYLPPLQLLLSPIVLRSFFSGLHPCRAELTLGMRSERRAVMLLLSAGSNGPDTVCVETPKGYPPLVFGSRQSNTHKPHTLNPTLSQAYNNRDTGTHKYIHYKQNRTFTDHK